MAKQEMIERISAGILTLFKNEFKDASVEEIRLGVGCALSSVHVAMLAHSDDKSVAIERVFDSMQRLAQSFQSVSEDLNLGVHFESGSVELPNNESEYN